MGKQMIEIRVEGREMCSDDDLEEMSLSSRLLAQASLTLTRSYRNGESCLTGYPPRKQKLGQVLYMPGFIVSFSGICLCMAENYGIAITPAWVVTMVIVVGLLSMAMPPVPGGALTAFAVMFA